MVKRKNFLKTYLVSVIFDNSNFFVYLTKFTQVLMYYLEVYVQWSPLIGLAVN